jgi:divalent metal cation (Fe/Co/Zn/Cd) transporter
MALFALFLAYYAVEAVVDSLRSAAQSNSTLGAPIAIPQGLWAFGLVFFAAVSVFALVRASRWMTRDWAENLVRAATVEHDPEPKGQEKITE